MAVDMAMHDFDCGIARGEFRTARARVTAVCDGPAEEGISMVEGQLINKKVTTRAQDKHHPTQ